MKTIKNNSTKNINKDFMNKSLVLLVVLFGLSANLFSQHLFTKRKYMKGIYVENKVLSRIKNGKENKTTDINPINSPKGFSALSNDKDTLSLTNSIDNMLFVKSENESQTEMLLKSAVNIQNEEDGQDNIKIKNNNSISFKNINANSQLKELINEKNISNIKTNRINAVPKFSGKNNDIVIDDDTLMIILLTTLGVLFFSTSILAITGAWTASLILFCLALILFIIIKERIREKFYYSFWNWAFF